MSAQSDELDVHRLAFTLRSAYGLRHMDLLILAADLIAMAARDSPEHETPRGLSERLFNALPNDEEYRKSLEPPV